MPVKHNLNNDAYFKSTKCNFYQYLCFSLMTVLQFLARICSGNLFSPVLVSEDEKPKCVPNSFIVVNL